MVEVEKTWRRWCGPRSELVRATELAAEILRGWTGVQSTVGVRIEERGGLTETASGVDAINSPHERELAHVDRLVVTVRPDREEWWKLRDEARERGEDPGDLPDASVSIRVSKYGTSLSVEGEDRTSVEGLVQRLAPILGRAATNSPGFDRDLFFFLLGLPLVIGGLTLGPIVVQWLDLAEKNDRLDAAEIVGLVGGALLPIAVVAGLWWIFPPVEIFDEGGAGRARRFRKWIVTAVGALAVAIVGAFIYDQVK